MPLWGNTDAANSEPIWPEMREVIKITELVTANATVAGKSIKFRNAANTITQANTGIVAGAFVWICAPAPRAAQPRENRR